MLLFLLLMLMLMLECVRGGQDGHQGFERYGMRRSKGGGCIPLLAPSLALGFRQICNAFCSREAIGWGDRALRKIENRLLRLEHDRRIKLESCGQLDKVCRDLEGANRVRWHHEF